MKRILWRRHLRIQESINHSIRVGVDSIEVEVVPSSNDSIYINRLSFIIGGCYNIIWYHESTILISIVFIILIVFKHI